METGRISGGQLVAIMFWAIMGTAVISLPVLIALHAPRDAWMAAVIFTFAGIGLSLVIGSVAKLMEGQDFPQYVELVFGKWLGKLLLLLFLAWLFHTTSLVIIQITNFTQISLLPNTPLLPIKLIFILPSIYAVYLGLEAMGRSGQFLFFITISVVALLFFLQIPDFNMQNFLPVFDDGLNNILRSSLAPIAWAGEIIFILFLVPFIKSQNKISMFAIITIMLIGVGGIINELAYTAVFGPLRQHLINPFYTIIRYIRPTAFIERYDILFVSMNLFGNFVKLSVFIYVLVFTLARILGIKSYRPLIIPTAIGLMILTNFAAGSPTEKIQFLDSVYPFYAIPILYGLPLLVLLVGKIRSTIISNKKRVKE